MKDGSFGKGNDGSACLAGGAREATDRVDEIPPQEGIRCDDLREGNDEEPIPPQVQEGRARRSRRSGLRPPRFSSRSSVGSGPVRPIWWTARCGGLRSTRCPPSGSGHIGDIPASLGRELVRSGPAALQAALSHALVGISLVLIPDGDPCDLQGARDGFRRTLLSFRSCRHVVRSQCTMLAASRHIQGYGSRRAGFKITHNRKDQSSGCRSRAMPCPGSSVWRRLAAAPYWRSANRARAAVLAHPGHGR